MANAKATTRFFSAADLGLTAANATTGVWASQLAANIYSLHKAAAATTSVVNIPIPPSPRSEPNDDAQPSVIKVYYKVATADLSAAPTAVLNQITAPTGTGIVARAAVTQVLSFGGVDAVGTTATAGDHIAIVTVTTPATKPDTDAYVLALTMNEAATSVLDIFGAQVTYK